MTRGAGRLYWLAPCFGSVTDVEIAVPCVTLRPRGVKILAMKSRPAFFKVKMGFDGNARALVPQPESEPIAKYLRLQGARVKLDYDLVHQCPYPTVQGSM